MDAGLTPLSLDQSVSILLDFHIVSTSTRCKDKFNLLASSSKHRIQRRTKDIHDMQINNTGQKLNTENGISHSSQDLKLILFCYIWECEMVEVDPKRVSMRKRKLPKTVQSSLKRCLQFLSMQVLLLHLLLVPLYNMFFAFTKWTPLYPPRLPSHPLHPTSPIPTSGSFFSVVHFAKITLTSPDHCWSFPLFSLRSWSRILHVSFLVSENFPFRLSQCEALVGSWAGRKTGQGYFLLGNLLLSHCSWCIPSAKAIITLVW